MTKKKWVIAFAICWLLLFSVFWLTKRYGYNGFLIGSILSTAVAILVYRFYLKTGN